MNRLRLKFAARLLFLLTAAISVTSAQQVELRTGWRMVSAHTVNGDGKMVSSAAYDASNWYGIARMPATVLQVLEDNGVYPNLYFGMNMNSVPRDLYKQDWWYRTTFIVPDNKKMHWLIFKGINYRAEIWLNGKLVADNKTVVGMYNEFRIDVSKEILPSAENVLAVKVTPEQRIQDVDGVVELADSWHDWINWEYFGIHETKKDLNISFLPDRNAGVWKQVYLESTGPVELEDPYVVTELPLPKLSPAALTIYCNLKNSSDLPVTGTLIGEVSREGRPAIHFQQAVRMTAGEAREIKVDPKTVAELTLIHPDLWWPYQWGKPNLYQLKLEFKIADEVSASKTIHFGIRKITQHRDEDRQFPEVGPDGNFYLKVNGKDFLVRGAVYTPDLLYKYDESREEAVIRYAKDLGINMLRWESKISSEHILELADREGIPLMFGWMCCNQWEKWQQWDVEDQRVARDSLRSQIRLMRTHPSVVLWANGSDGLPPQDVKRDYDHIVLDELHWQNALVGTVSEMNKDADGNTQWNGIHMMGPYAWRPPNYWFDGRYPASRGSNAEQGDNEHIPPFESLKKFIPADKLWPMNEYWYMHAGGGEGNNRLATIQRVIDKRYGPSASATDFASKAQMAHYENTRAQFEAYAAGGWANHKFTLYWMLDNQWPSFFGHLFDYYLEPGGAYFGAKQALRPLNVVYDYYATGDRSVAKIYVVNQTLIARKNLKVVVRFYNIDGTIAHSKLASGIQSAASSSVIAMQLPRVKGLSKVYFVRCQLMDESNALLAENVYWQALKEDDAGDPSKDAERKFTLEETSWADFSMLNSMAIVDVSLSGSVQDSDGESTASMQLINRSNRIAFFLRAEVTKGADGDEVLPITYDDNYVTLFPHQTLTLHAKYKTTDAGDGNVWIRLQGRNTPTNAVLSVKK